MGPVGPGRGVVPVSGGRAVFVGASAVTMGAGGVGGLALEIEGQILVVEKKNLPDLRFAASGVQGHAPADLSRSGCRESKGESVQHRLDPARPQFAQFVEQRRGPGAEDQAIPGARRKESCQSAALSSKGLYLPEIIASSPDYS